MANKIIGVDVSVTELTETMMACPVKSEFYLKWTSVAIALGIQTMDREDIKSLKTLEEICSLMLEKWINQTPQHARVGDLVAALHKKELNSMASCIIKKYYVGSDDFEKNSILQLENDGIDISERERFFEIITNSKLFEIEISLPKKRLIHPDDGYRLPVNYKGEALVMNVTEFDNLYDNRLEANTDTVCMQDLWRDLGFNVTMKEGRIDCKMFANIMEYFTRKLDAEADELKACVVFIGSHGEFDKIHLSDGKLVDIYNEIIYKITDLECLQGKPKLFIFNACIEKHTEPENYGTRLKSVQDTIICASSQPRKELRRDTFPGSWFVNCLAYTLMKNSYRLDLESMLNTTEMSMRNVLKVKNIAVGQQPYHTNHSLKTVYFNTRAKIEGMPMLSTTNPEKIYFEDKHLVLPVLENVAMSNGSLWDCHKSTTVPGFTLFLKSLVSVKIDDIHATDYTLRHVKSTSDRYKSFRVGEEVLLELVSGLIRTGDEADYHSNNSMSFSEEELLCSYDLTTSSVEILPSVTINKDVVESVMKGIIKATHVVVATHIGAKVVASIRVKETNLNNTEDSVKSFLGKITFGPVTAAAKANLEALDTEAMKNFEKIIKVTTRPSIDVEPETIQEVFQVVTLIRKEISKHVAFEISDKKAYGVPVRFILAPIQQFIEVPVQRLYLQSSDKMLGTLTGYLLFLQDLKVYQFLRKKVLDAEPDLKNILHDTNNPLTKAVVETEDCYRTKANSAYKSLVNLFKEYKHGTISSVIIMDTIRNLGKDLSLTVVHDKAMDFVLEGRELLKAIGYNCIEDSHKIFIFTNPRDRDLWFKATKPLKILLQGGNTEFCRNTLVKLYVLSTKLESIGIQIGIALPNISSDKNSLTLKINSIEEWYETPQSIQNVLQVLTLLGNEAGTIATRFLTIYASLAGFKSRLSENLPDLHSLIKCVEKTCDVTIVETSIQTRNLCLEDNDTVKIMINLDCLDSAMDSVAKYKLLQNPLKDSVKWVVGKWDFNGIQEQCNFPVVFAFKKGALIGACYDTIDILLLCKALGESNVNQEEYLSLLRPKNENLIMDTFNLMKDQCARKFTSKLQPRSSLLNFLDLPCANNSTVLELAKRLIRSIINQNWIDVYSTMKEWIFLEHSETEDYLQAEPNISSDKRTALISSLQNLLAAKNPYRALVLRTIESISRMKSQKDDISNANTLINEVLNHEECPKSLADQLKIMQDLLYVTGNDKKVIQLLLNYLQIHDSDPNVENIDKLLVALQNSNDSDQEHVVTKELLPGFIFKIEILDDNYPGATPYLKQCLGSSNFYGVLHVLKSISVHPILYRLQVSFESLTFADDAKDIGNIIISLAQENLTLEQYESVFGNPSFQLLSKNAANSSTFLEICKRGFYIKGDLSFIPEYLRDKLALLPNDEESLETTFSEKCNSIQ